MASEDGPAWNQFLRGHERQTQFFCEYTSTMHESP